MFRKKTLRFFLLFFVLFDFITSVAAQDTLLPATYHGKLDSINSIVLHQKRFIQVFVPSTYKPGTRDTYDVLYVLDGGNWSMNVVSQVNRFLKNEGLMPPTIIVSVMGIDRNIELTPTVLKTWLAPTGGADKFLAYISDELIPYINKNYPSNGDNTLWGHSLGGMFATFAMLKKPTLFKSYIAIDPSLWWDNSYVPKMAAHNLENLTDTTITLFISSRDAPSFHDMKIDTMETILKKYAPSNLKWKLTSYPGETHSSIRLKGTYAD
jgi:predicted alpha/beta superfamily hydrolase